MQALAQMRDGLDNLDLGKAAEYEKRFGAIDLEAAPEAVTQQ